VLTTNDFVFSDVQNKKTRGKRLRDYRHYIELIIPTWIISDYLYNYNNRICNSESLPLPQNNQQNCASAICYKSEGSMSRSLKHLPSTTSFNVPNHQLAELEQEKKSLGRLGVDGILNKGLYEGSSTCTGWRGCIMARGSSNSRASGSRN
jgi:hypothetical protein